MLTAAQRTTLKNAILAETNPTLVAARNAGNIGAIADFYNADSTNYVWKSGVDVSDIFSMITWASMTPVDTPDGTQAWANRSLACQGKQFNLQTMLAGRETLPSGKVNIRAGLQDALTNIPAGPGGSTIAANWVGVRDFMKRLATRCEVLFAPGGTQSAPGDLVFEGYITVEEVIQTLNG